jgi:hypothetical protein
MQVYLTQVAALLERWGVDGSVIDELSEEHERLTDKREDARREARSYLREDKKVLRAVSYAPTATELAARLGCNGPKPKAVKCDNPGPYQCGLITIDPDRARPAPHEEASPQAPAR